MGPLAEDLEKTDSGKSPGGFLFRVSGCLSVICPIDNHGLRELLRPLRSLLATVVNGVYQLLAPQPCGNCPYAGFHLFECFRVAAELVPDCSIEAAARPLPPVYSAWPVSEASSATTANPAPRNLIGPHPRRHSMPANSFGARYKIGARTRGKIDCRRR